MKHIYSIAILPLLLLSSTSTTPTVALMPAVTEVIATTTQATSTVSTIDIEVKKIADTIKYKESRNDTKCTKRGRDGEYGCFQIMPGTWRNLTKKHLGQVKGFSVELERPVVEKEIKELLLQNLKPKQIFKKWNSGNTGPCSKGINKNGTPYDSCAYINEAMRYYSKL